MTARLVPAGVDLGRIRTWLADRVPGDVAGLSAHVLSGGRSNVTYRLAAADGRQWVLRRPPLGHLLPTAHDVVREHRVMRALASTDVPVPRMVGVCDDASVIGTPFFVMENIDGSVVRRTADLLMLPYETRSRIGLSTADVLARVHAIRPESAGLGDLSRTGDDYVGRQLRRWMRQYRQNAHDEVPEIEQAHRLLLDRQPPQRHTGIVHGDFRLDNVMLDRSGAVSAVMDWELCALGDPLADVGQMLLRTMYPGHVENGVSQAPLESVDGFPGGAQIMARYSETAGVGLGGIVYYIAFASWKAACILHGVNVRQKAGVMPGRPTHEDGLDGVVRFRARHAISLLS